MIEVGDKVKFKLLKGGYGVGQLETICDFTNGRIGLVRVDGNLIKVLVSDLERVEETVTLTRAEFDDYKRQILDRDTFDMEDTSYEIIKVSAELIFKRLESLLFGAGNKSEG